MANRKFWIGMLVIALVFSMAVVGCDDGSTNGNGNNGKKGNLSKLDIVGATNLFIAPVSVARNARAAGDSSVNKLFKITEDGYVQEVTYTYEDEDGNPVTSTETLSPSSIIVLTDDYLIIGFGYNNNYLVNSNTGACYIYTNDFPPSDQSKTYWKERIGEDKNGNIYFISSNGVVKLSITDINNVTLTTASAPNDSVTYFGVDHDGNIGYQGHDSGNNQVLRYRKNNGGLEVLPGQTNFYTPFWTGFNGKLYYYNSSIPDGVIFFSDIVEISSEPYSVIDYGTNNWGDGFNTGIGIDNLLRIKTSKRIIGYNNSGAVELYNEQTNKATGIPISTFGLVSIKFGIASDEYYYLAGTSIGTPKSVLVKINPINNSCTTLIDGGYDIYKMTVGSDDVITFNALQMSNGAIVVGQVSSLTNFEILDVTLTEEVTVLERIK